MPAAAPNGHCGERPRAGRRGGHGHADVSPLALLCVPEALCLR
jgi:hypothetical protein